MGWAHRQIIECGRAPHCVRKWLCRNIYSFVVRVSLRARVGEYQARVRVTMGVRDRDALRLRPRPRPRLRLRP